MSRAEATGRPGYKRPESVLVVVATRAGEVLMLERCHPAGFWQSVTGSLERDETPLQAARRELREETGLAAGGHLEDRRRARSFPILPAWRARYAPGVIANLEHVFTAIYPERPAVLLNPREHCRLCWLPREAAADLAASHTNRDAILAYVAAGPPR